MAELGIKLKVAVCKAIGIDPAICNRLDIHANPHDLMTIEASFIPTLTDEQLADIADALIADGKQVKVILQRTMVRAANDG